MALINCPECARQISDTAEICPHCGFKISEQPEFEVKITQLSKPKFQIMDRLAELIGGIVVFAIGIPLVTIVVGIFLMIIGIFMVGHAIFRSKVQTGDCPYCGTNLTTRGTGNTFTCPHCNNTGKKTETTFETTH